MFPCDWSCRMMAVNRCDRRSQFVKHKLHQVQSTLCMPLRPSLPPSLSPSLSLFSNVEIFKKEQNKPQSFAVWSFVANPQNELFQLKVCEAGFLMLSTWAFMWASLNCAQKIQAIIFSLCVLNKHTPTTHTHTQADSGKFWPTNWRDKAHWQELCGFSLSRKQMKLNSLKDFSNLLCNFGMWQRSKAIRLKCLWVSTCVCACMGVCVSDRYKLRSESETKPQNMKALLIATK